MGLLFAVVVALFVISALLLAAMVLVQKGNGMFLLLAIALNRMTG